MNKNPRALITLIRNKLNNSSEDVLEWFQQKGIQVKKEGDIFFLKANEKSNSEISHVCNGLIFRQGQLLLFPGYIIPSMTLKEAQNDPKLVWDENTIFIEYINGKHVRMYWDPYIEKWTFAGENQIKSSYANTLKRSLYGIMSVDPAYSFNFIFVESGTNQGIYLDTMYHTKKLAEESWKDVYKNSIRLKVKHPNLYTFEGFEYLEESDFPIIMRDKSANKVLLTGLE